GTMRCSGATTSVSCGRSRISSRRHASSEHDADAARPRLISFQPATAAQRFAAATRHGFDSNNRPAAGFGSTVRANRNELVLITQRPHDSALTPIIGVGVLLNRDAGLAR